MAIDKRLAAGCVMAWLGWLGSIVAIMIAAASLNLYDKDQPLNAIYLLLLAVVIYRWSDTTILHLPNVPEPDSKEKRI